MRQNSQSTLRMTKRISRNSHSWIVVKLFFEIMKAQLKVLDNVIIVSTALVMLNVTSSKYLPILCFQELLYLLFILATLLAKPTFKEPYFAVEKGSMCLLSFVAHLLSKDFAIPKNIFSDCENIFNWSKAVRCKVSQYIAFIRFRVIVALEIENPESIKMRVYSHM